jgi:hypothetical protein
MAQWRNERAAEQLTRVGHMGAANGINVGSVGGDFSLRAGGDIVAGDKIVINYLIQCRAEKLTTTPYKLLTSYDIADRAIFYGCAGEIEELTGAVARHNVIIINGASGAGKSSLVNAGMIPRLAENGYSYVAFREYIDPLKQFAQKAGVTTPDTNDPRLLLQLIRAVHTTIVHNLERADLPELSGLWTIETLEMAELHGPIVVVLDQLSVFSSTCRPISAVASSKALSIVWTPAVRRESSSLLRCAKSFSADS